METYTPEQAAKILQVNVQTVRRWLRRGELTGANTTAGWRLTPADLETWLNANRQPRPPRGSMIGLNRGKPRQAKQEQPDDEDAHWVTEAEAVLDRIACGEETTITFDEWERRCDALDG